MIKRKQLVELKESIEKRLKHAENREETFKNSQFSRGYWGGAGNAYDNVLDKIDEILGGD